MSSLLSSNNRSILNAHIDNFTSARSSIGLRISGKGLNDASNSTYNNHGIGFQLLSNINNYKELAIIDTSNFNVNTNYSTLRIAITEQSIAMRSIASNNNYKPLIINNNIVITSNFIGIGTTNPQATLDIRGNIMLDGLILKPDSSVYNFSQWSNTSTNSSNIYYNIGNVGIGTINPQSLLHLSSPLLSSTINIQFTDATTGHTRSNGFIIGKDSNQHGVIWNYENDDIIFGTSNRERLRITSNGRIGIGTANPQATLDVRGDLRVSGSILKLDGSLYFNNTSNQWINSSNSSNIYYNNGNVGIGISNPQSLLHLSSVLQTNAVDIRFTDATTGYTVNDGFIIGKDSNQNGVIWNYENNDIIFGTSNRERLRITSNGRIGIGTNNPQATLDVRGDVNIAGSLTINNSNVNNINIKFNSNIFFYNSNQELNISNLTATSNTLRFTNDFININNLIINGNIYKSSNLIENYWQKTPANSNNIYYNLGNIGIGITNPSFKLHIIGDVNITGNYKRNNTDITVSGSSITFSDTRIKTNIIDINDDNALQQILTIEPKIYNYIDKKERGNDTVYGFIAQQIREVIPHAVKVETQFIPNIYKPYPYINNHIYTDEDLTVLLNSNDVIRVKGIDNNYLIANIIDITSNCIKIDKEINGNECFIYGKEINDFHMLDKSYIYTLNVCAIQDLYKMIKELENKILLQDIQINQLIQINTSNTSNTSNISIDTSNTSNTSNIAIDTSNIAIDTSNIAIDTSNTSNTLNIAIDTSNIAIDTSNIAIDTSNTSNTSNIAIDTSNISIDTLITSNTSNIAIDTSNIATDISNIAIGTSNIVIDTSNISIDTLITGNTSNIAIDTSNISIDTSNTSNTSNISIDTSNIAIDTSNIAIDTSNIAIGISNIELNII